MPDQALSAFTHAASEGASNVQHQLLLTSQLAHNQVAMSTVITDA